MRRWLFVCLTIAGCCRSVLTAGDPPKPYNIKLNADPVIGERIHLRMVTSTERLLKMTMGGKTVKDQAENLKAETIGTGEILAVSPHKKTQRLKFIVEKLTFRKDGGSEQSPFVKGTEIIASLAAEGQRVYTA